MPTVPRSSRSKGCQQCIRRRVKCDERSEGCRQCVRLGLRCSGPIQGVIILDMTAKVARGCNDSSAKPQNKKRKEQKKTLNFFAAISQNSVNTVESSSAHSTSPSTEGLDYADRAVNSSRSASDLEWNIRVVHEEEVLTESKFPAIETEHLYSNDFLDDLFVAQFVEQGTSSRLGQNSYRPRSWVFALPSFLSSTSKPSVRYCIRAAVMVFYAMVHRNKSAEANAARWYLAGLESHRLSLGQSKKNAGPGITLIPQAPDGQDICVPMLFSFFETMKGTTSDAWEQHMTAAEGMLEARGSWNCRIGLEHAMFRSIRPYAAFKSILHNKPSGFDSPEWCAIPFSENPRMSFDFLIDILLSLPRQLNLPSGTNCLEAIQNLNYTTDATRERIKHKSYCLLHKLHDWWWHFEKENNGFANTGPSCDESSDPATLPATAMYVYRDTLTATSVALYNAANIILHSVLLHLAICSKVPCAPEISPIPRYRSSITSHSCSILMVTAYMNWKDPYCGDTQRSVFAVRVALWFSVDKEQRSAAQKILEHANTIGSLCW